MKRPAGFWVRAAAAAIDGAVGVVLALLFSSSLGMFFARRAVVTLRIGDPETWWRGPVPLMLGVVGEVVYLLPIMWFLAWSLDPLTGATIGKRLSGLRVSDADGRSPTAQTGWRRCLIQTAGLWGTAVALVAGRWEIAVVATFVGAVMLMGSLLALGPASRALHDRLSATRVVRTPTGVTQP